MAAIRIKVRANGPYKVEAPEGGVTLIDADGNEYDLTGKTDFVLCRCGASQTKPFCDRSHSRTGFVALETVTGTPAQNVAGAGKK